MKTSIMREFVRDRFQKIFVEYQGMLDQLSRLAEGETSELRVGRIMNCMNMS